jgi:hypothetical protein
MDRRTDGGTDGGTDGRTDGRREGRTDGQTDGHGETSIPSYNFFAGGIIKWVYYHCKKSLKIPKGGNQNPYIEEEQTTQWPKETVQKDKQRSTKHTHKTKDRVQRTPLKTGGELRCFGG